MKPNFKAWLAFVISAGGLVLVASADPSPFQEEKQPAIKAPAPGLEGGYMIVSGEKDGKAIPEDRIKGSIVRFTGDKIVGTDKDKKEFFASTYTLDTAKTPWVIKMKSTAPKEAEAVGLIKKDGDTVTIVYSLPGTDAPTEFKTADKQHLFVMKASKPQGKDKPRPNEKQ